ncbi:MAG: putative Ntn-hydrolase superfamily protein [Saprospiraceae bacterium]|jgi:uncharacterized Ntn-hydrolase superfamily protein
MKTFFLFFSLFAFTLQAQDTFSIVAVDPETGEVGAAGASCIDDDDCGGCGGVIIISGLIPGRGGMNSQAYACIPNVNLQNGIEQLNTGSNPQEAMDWVIANDACLSGGGTNNNSAYRQYGFADLDENNVARTAAFTGASTDAYAGHITGDNYAIQGNILLGEEILTNMEQGFLNTEGSLADKLMAALQGANVPGADTRCLAAGISSKSSFIRVAKPDDELGNLFLEINVPIVPEGVEPIDTLQTLFDEWKATQISSSENIDNQSFIHVFPNPTKGDFSIEVSETNFTANLTLSLYDIEGKNILIRDMNERKMQISRTDLNVKGLILAEIRNNNKDIVGSTKILLQ